MSKKLTAIKNAIWAICLVAALGVLFVALIYAAVRRYGGEQFSGRIELGGRGAAEASVQESSSVGGEETALRILSKTKDMGQSYIEELYFLCDSRLSALAGSGLVNAAQVWSSRSGSIPAGTLSDFRILLQDGSEISPREAAMVKKPKLLVISLGSDGLAELDRETFVEGYEALIASILATSPETQIICLSQPSVCSEYSGTDGLTAELIANANGWIRELCAETGVYYADAADALDRSGKLKEDYASYDGKSLNLSGLTELLDYLRKHALIQ